MKNWISLSEERRKEIFVQTAEKLNLTSESVEKDFWVVVVLRAIFSLKISSHLVFKGGTSLSKCWNYLQRFSEDIDIAMNRELIGYGGELSRTKAKSMRKVACQYVSNDFKNMLQQQLVDMGFSAQELTVEAEETEAGTTDRDPQKLFVNYNSIISRSGYLKEKVIIEIGSRSQLEPSEKRKLNSLVADAFPDGSFIQEPLEVIAISPKRTFMEKLILLHEEFSKQPEQIRSERMSRHLYDIERLMETEYGIDALRDKELFKTIISHRNLFTPIKGVDYESLEMNALSFMPPDSLLPIWEKDYNTMRGEMFYGKSLDFTELLKRLEELSKRLKK